MLLESNIPGLKLRSRGKVRDIYDVGANLLIIATDRISAYDCVMPVGIPQKGAVLTQLSLFWFDMLKGDVGNHLLPPEVVDSVGELASFRNLLPRCMLVRRAEMLPVECVARGYLSGSGWKEYQSLGSICGIPLPAGLKESSRLPEPIFTPASKAETGHDENIAFDKVVDLVGAEAANRARDLTLAIYAKAAQYALERGIIIADTKFEFGYIDGELKLADEVFTPDSSRFWPLDSYAPGHAQPSYDKQFVRDYLETLDWNKQPPAPVLPENIVEKTAAKYKQAFHLLTGQEFGAK